MNDAEGFVLADAMITAGLLTEINATRIRERAPNGAVLISCGDRDRFRYHFEGCGSIVNIHAICLNGGGALLGDHVDLSRRRVILEDTVEAFAVKSLSFVLDLAHFPCGKCKKLGMGFRETLLRTLEGRQSRLCMVDRGRFGAISAPSARTYRHGTGRTGSGEFAA